MAYNPKKDQELKSWEIDLGHGKRAVVSLRRYAGGEPKLDLSHQVIEKPETGEIAHAKIRRWHFEALRDLREVIDQALEYMDSLAAKGRK